MVMKVLDPSPVGWFAVALSHELKQGDEKHGVLCAKPYHLRRNVAGELTYDGAITAVKEQNGFIMAWHHPLCEAPDWTVPELNNEEWRPLLFSTLSANSHPQETFENSIDMAHFPIVHGFQDISVLQEPTFEPHSMFVRYQIARKHPLPFIKKPVKPSFEVRIHGIGCAHNHIDIPDFGMRVRMFAMSTPTEPGKVDIRLGVTINQDCSLPFFKWLAPMVHQGIKQNVVDDFCQDIEIWESKQYQAPPVLVKGDGPIARFRQWCEQYYLTEKINCDVAGRAA